MEQSEWTLQKSRPSATGPSQKPNENSNDSLDSATITAVSFKTIANTLNPSQSLPETPTTLGRLTNKLHSKHSLMQLYPNQLLQCLTKKDNSESKLIHLTTQ